MNRLLFRTKSGFSVFEVLMSLSIAMIGALALVSFMQNSAYMQKGLETKFEFLQTMNLVANSLNSSATCTPNLANLEFEPSGTADQLFARAVTIHGLRIGASGPYTVKDASITSSDGELVHSISLTKFRLLSPDRYAASLLIAPKNLLVSYVIIKPKEISVKLITEDSAVNVGLKKIIGCTAGDSVGVGKTVPKVQEWVTAGTYSFSVPSNAGMFTMTIVGGGGGGKGGWWAGDAFFGGGGGSGAYAYNAPIAIRAGEVLTIIVGSGGAGGSGVPNGSPAAGPGEHGQNSSIQTESGTITAAGGMRGEGTTPGLGGAAQPIYNVRAGYSGGVGHVHCYGSNGTAAPLAQYGDTNPYGAGGTGACGGGNGASGASGYVKLSWWETE